MTSSKHKATQSRGKLRIGDDWNAINIIALSQSNPLKALAEFVENSIDAGAKHVTIVRGKEKGAAFVSVTDDGEGIRKDKDGVPDFRYVATHICDSMKRHLKADGQKGLQGEFGIGLLSFWTLGEELTLTCGSDDGETWQMSMRKGDTDYIVRKRRTLLGTSGTELKVQPLLPGIRQLSGDKLQWYLASELRDRIRTHNVDVRIIDRTARKEFKVEPRAFDGRLVHNLPDVTTPLGEIYFELYIDDPSPERKVGLYRNGTRVLDDITTFGEMKAGVWGSGYFEGIVDVPFLNLTPGTRLGVIRDDKFMRAWFALRPVEDKLEAMINELRQAEEERASKRVLNSIRRAFKEALLTLPAEEYDWFDIQAGIGRKVRGGSAPIENGNGEGESPEQDGLDGGTANGERSGQTAFFEFPGPLFSVRISPTSSVIQVGGTRALRAVARDRSRRDCQDVFFQWEVVEGQLAIDNPQAEIVTVTAPARPQLVRVKVTATQKDVACETEALVTVTESLTASANGGSGGQSQGLPGYTFQKAAGELWRSRFDEAQNVIVVNNGHRDFVYASRSHSLQLRYIARLYAKELVLKNFQGMKAGELLERMLELSLYTEENLK
ncbi:MAG TPA: ATP-binding protein [Pseudomonadales bacterium]|nr:ATP-binding protein [Pseudomonadales bacterium]